MNITKKTALALLLFGLPNNTPARSMDTIMILEKGWAENMYMGSGFLLFYLKEAIKQQAAPIIVSEPILHSFFCISGNIQNSMAWRSDNSIKQ